jgi:hypothetical protein
MFNLKKRIQKMENQLNAPGDSKSIERLLEELQKGRFGNFNFASLFADFIHTGAEDFKKTAAHLPRPLAEFLTSAFKGACKKKNKNKQVEQDKA